MIVDGQAGDLGSSFATQIEIAKLPGPPGRRVVHQNRAVLLPRGRLDQLTRQIGKLYRKAHLPGEQISGDLLSDYGSDRRNLRP